MATLGTAKRCRRSLQTLEEEEEEEEVSTDLVSPDLVSVAGNEVRVSV